MDKKAEYDKLIMDVKASYQKLNEDKNSDGVYMTWCDDCQEINLWTYWQGRGCLNPKIMLVGQDWGAIDDAQIISNVRNMNSGLEYGYFGKRIYDTDRNLNSLFESIGYHDIISNRYPDLFFTNLSLGYRSRGTSGNLKDTWLKHDYEFFARLVSILEPEIIICLGKATFEGTLDALGVEDKPKIKTYNDFIVSESNPVTMEIGNNEVKIFGFAHCGAMGTLNRNNKKDRSLDKQIEDWKRILE